MDNPPTDSQNPYASPAIPKETERSSLSTSANAPNMPLVEPIRTSGALSLQDYYYGVRLGRSRLRRFAILFFIALPLFFIIWDLSPAIAFNNLGMTIFIYAAAMTFGSLLVIVLRWLLQWRVRRIHAAGKGVFAPTESVMYEDHYEVHQASMDAKIFWTMFCKFRYSNRLVVVYYEGNPFLFGIIPRGKFQSQHDWECFIGLLDRKMPRG